MIENFLAGSAALFGDPFTIGIFVFGVVGGMLFGAIPGVSMLTLAAILLPFTAGLEPAQGVMLFAVIYCTGTYGGAITAILFNIPGSAENAPTAFDGYPMTQKGQSGKAVGAAVLCSAIGGIASALVMMAATEPLANWAIRNIAPFPTATRSTATFPKTLTSPTNMSMLARFSWVASASGSSEDPVLTGLAAFLNCGYPYWRIPLEIASTL